LLPKLAFRQSDLIVIFAITSVCAAIAGEWGRVGQAHAYSFTTRAEIDPTARDYFVKYLPNSMTIKDPAALKDLQAGGHDLLYVLGKLPLYLPKR
jgi:hypothetical protein